MKKIICILFGLLFILGCPGPQRNALAPFDTTSMATSLEDDEQRLWNRADESQKLIAKSGIILDDPALETYLNSVARALQPPEIMARVPFTVKVIKERTFNAFALPNGAIFLHTGILARMDNEAQLALLLGHEMTHTTNRHMANQVRGMKNFDVLLLGNLAAAGYSRELETEADASGFKLLVNAGYDPRAAVPFFHSLKEYALEEKEHEKFFFGTHPKIQERIDNFEKYLASCPASGGKKNETEFLKNIRNALLVNATLNMEQGKYNQAQKELEKSLVATPQDAVAYTMLGTLALKKGEEGAQKKALESFDKAIAIDAKYADAYKNKGVVLLKKGDKQPAKAALQQYLALSPDAYDRKFVEAYIKQCSEDEKK